MTYKPTGKMIQEKPREEKRRVCDQCGEFIDHEAGAIKPHFEVAWRPMLGYDDEGSVSWTAEIIARLTSLGQLEAYLFGRAA